MQALTWQWTMALGTSMMMVLHTVRTYSTVSSARAFRNSSCICTHTHTHMSVLHNATACMGSSVCTAGQAGSWEECKTEVVANTYEHGL